METLQKHDAMWHKTCRDKISSRMLERAKRKLQSEDAPISPAKTRKTTVKHEPDYCFFCGYSARWVFPLHKVPTMEVDEKVRKKAIDLGHHNLLNKLAAGDMIATDSVYHNAYLQNFYKRAARLKPRANKTSQRRLEKTY